jgi:hypothetical protein
MKLYQSIKQVEAAKIARVQLTGGGNAILEFEGGGCQGVDAAYLIKHAPQPGGYYVRYQDGYESWSPAKAFEEGYVEVRHASHEEGLTVLQFDGKGLTEADIAKIRAALGKPLPAEQSAEYPAPAGHPQLSPALAVAGDMI